MALAQTTHLLAQETVLAEQQGNQNMQLALHITITVIADKRLGQHSSRMQFSALSSSSV